MIKVYELLVAEVVSKIRQHNNQEFCRQFLSMLLDQKMRLEKLSDSDREIDLDEVMDHQEKIHSTSDVLVANLEECKEDPEVIEAIRKVVEELDHHIETMRDIEEQLND